jgi:MFS family permease
MTTDRTSKRLPPAVIALGVTSFFTDVGSEMIFPLLPVFVASIGAAPVFLGLVEGVADATSSLIKLASGYAADRAAARKPLVLIGYSIASFVRPLMALASAPWHVLAVRLTDRVGKGLRSSPRDALIASAVSNDAAGRAFGFHRAMDHAGAVVGPLVATLLLGLGWDLRAVFWAALVPGIAAMLALMTVREDRRPRAPIDPEVSAQAPAGTAVPLPRSLRSYFLVLALFSLGNSSDAFLLLRASELGIATASVPLLWSALHVSKVVSSYFGGGIADRIARPKLIVIGWAVYAATYLAFAAASEPWHAWALFIVYGCYYGLTEPAEKALVRELAPAEVRGRAYGFFNFITGATAIPAGLLMGFLWQTFGAYAALVTGALLAGASSLALLAWHSRSER